MSFPSPREFTLAAVIACLLAPLAMAQRAPTSISLPRSGHVQRLDGKLWATGLGYKASFGPEGVEFTPALGAGAPRSFPLTLRVTAIGRGDELRTATQVVPTQQGLRVRYVRPECVERYDVTGEAIAQSFEFATLPKGTGDLVVHLATHTELPLVHAGSDGLRYALPELGGVQIGGVTGIDASGRQVPGTIAAVAGGIELRLPRAFVDSAALPLVLDPQIGPVFSVITSSVDYQNPDIAFLQGGNEFLCVFERAISANDRDLRAFRLDSSGNALGPLMSLTAGATDDHDPAVGSTRFAGTYVVVYERGGDLLGRAVTPSGVVSPEVIVAAGTDNQIAPDVGSQWTLADDDCVVVWHNSTQAKIQAAQLTPSASGALSVFGQVDLAAGSPGGLIALGAPRIAHSEAGDGRFLIVYPRTPFLGDTKTQALLVDLDLTTLAAMPISTTAGNDEDSADVDGDGTHWVVVFESEANEGSGDNAIVAVPLYWRTQTGQLESIGERTVTSLVNVDEIDPVVSMLESSCVVAWRRRAAPGSTDTEVFCKSIDLLGCGECEPTVLLANSPNIETNLAAASTSSGFRSLVVWEIDTAGNGDLAGVAWQAADGSAANNPFSGCGTAGRMAAACSRVGNANHTLWLVDGDPSYSAFLVLSSTSANIHCGPCTLVPDPWNGFVSTMIPGLGQSAFGLPIPNLSALGGAQLVGQWIVLNPPGQCSFLQADFSNSLTITIE